MLILVANYLCLNRYGNETPVVVTAGAKFVTYITAAKPHLFKSFKDIRDCFNDQKTFVSLFKRNHEQCSLDVVFGVCKFPVNKEQAIYLLDDRYSVASLPKILAAPKRKFITDSDFFDYFKSSINYLEINS